MGKKYNIELAFTANAKQVEQELNQLKRSLADISNFTSLNAFKEKGLSKEILEASNAAMKLRSYLDKATDVDTNKLNLKQFAQSLRQGGTTLADFRVKLQALGPEGAEAFNQLTNSVLTANASIKNSEGLIAKLGKSFKNVLTWNISSGALNLMTQTFSNAVDYANSLNTSLTNIGIVTNKDVDAMARFAKSANKAAKELSTSTKEYSNASLIYFQQGLSDSEVKERTDLTIKMANVTGEAAEDVSSYMTAIWNNFADGQHTLEYYADIITALGAATASSSEEIAGGLEKFAAIADTVGLSYEYATSALATVVSATRQSEESVGTAFKTIFGRFQSLSLGETLEDGTNLTKYTQALATVGVDIKDSNGELKKMDEIVDELGQRWKILSKDQQVALANTVAGTRQYSNLISLLDNYDTFKGNLAVAGDATGTLEQQSRRYEESWEAASKRVKTSIESIYDTLIDDKAIIKGLDFLSKFIDKIEVLLKSMGGIPGIVARISTALMQTFKPQMAQGIDNFVFKTKTWMADTKQGPGIKGVAKGVLGRLRGTIPTTEERIREQALQESLKLEASGLSMQIKEKSMAHTIKRNDEGVISIVEEEKETSGLQRISSIQSKIYGIAKNLTAEQQEQAALQLDRQRKLENEYKQQYDLYLLAKKSAEVSRTSLKDATTSVVADRQNAIKQRQTSLKEIQTSVQNNMPNEENKHSGSYDIGKELAKNAEQKSTTRMGQIALLRKSGDIDEELETILINKIKGLEGNKGDTKQVTTILSEVDDELAKIIQKRLGVLAEEAKKTTELDVFKEQGVFSQATTQTKVDNEGNITETSIVQQAPTNVEEAWANAEKNISDLQYEISTLDTASDSLYKITEAAEHATQGYAELTKGNQEFAATLKRIDQTKGTGYLKQFYEILGQVEDGTVDSNDALKDFIEGIKKNLKDGVDAGKKKLEEYETSIKSVTDTYEGGADMAENFINNAKNVGTTRANKEKASQNSEIGAEDANKNLDELIKNTNKFGQTVSSVSIGLSNLASVWTTVASLPSIFTDEDMSAGDKAIAIITTLISLISSYSSMVQNASGFLGIFSKAKKKDATATGAQTGAEIAHKEATDAQTEAQVANNAAMMANPIWAAAALVALAAAALIISTISNNTKEHTEQLQKNTEASQKNLDSIKETISTFDTLIDQLAEVNAAFEKNTESAENFANTYNDLIDTLKQEYGQEWLDGNNLVASYTAEQIKAMEEGTRETLISQLSAYMEGLKQREIDISNKLQSDALTQFKDAVVNDQKIIKANGVIKFGAAKEDEEDALIKELRKSGDSELAKLFEFSKGEKNLTMTMKTNVSAEDTVAGFEALQKFINDPKNATLINGGGELGTNLIKLIDSNSEIISQIDEANKAQNEAQFDYIKYATKASTVDMSDYNAYYKWYQTALDKAKNEGKNKEWLDEQIAQSEFSNAQDVIEALETTYGDYMDNTSDILEYYASLPGEGMKEAFRSLTKQDLINVKNDNQLKALLIEQLEENFDRNLTAYLEENKISQSVYEEYLKNLNKEGKVDLITKQTALRIAELSKVLPNAAQAWDEYGYSVLTAEQDSYEFLNAAENMIASLKEVMGVEVSVEWFKNRDNINYLNQFLRGELDDPTALFNSIGADAVKSYGNQLTSDTAQFITNKFGNETIDGWSSMYNKLTIDEKSSIDNIMDAYGYIYDEVSDSLTRMDTSELKKQLSEMYTVSEQDIYNAQKVNLDRLQRKRNDITELKNKAYGQNKLDFIDEEETLLIDEKNLLETYLTEYQDKEDGKIIKAQEALLKANTTGTIIDFDEITGEIKNYDELIKKGINQEALDTYYKVVNNALDYDNQLKVVKDLLKDNELETIEVTLDYKLEVNEEALNQIEYALSMTETAQEKMSLIANKTEVLTGSIDARTNMLNNIAGKYTKNNGEKYTLNDFINMSEAEIGALGISEEDKAIIQENVNGLRDDMTSLNETKIEMGEQLAEYFENTVDKMAGSIDKMSTLQGFLDSYKSIIEVTGKDLMGISNDLLKSISQENQKVANNMLEASKSNYDNLLQTQQDTLLKLQEATAEGSGASEETIKYWEDTYNAVTERVQEAKSTLLDNWQGALEAAISAFEEAVSIAIESMEKALAGGFGNLSYLQTAYDQQKTLSEQYLDEYETAYELSKLTRAISKSVDDTKNIKGKQLLKSLQAEITSLEAEGTKISEYDLQILQKEYDLRLAQIALEESQNAKTQVRLQQTASGDLSYIYTANQSAIDEAEQKVADIQKELYSIRKEYIDNMSADLLSIIQDFSSSLNEIANDTALSETQRKERIQELYGYTVSQITYAEEGLNKALEGSSIQFSDTILSNLIPAISNYNSILDYFTANASTAVNSINTELDALKTTTNEINSLVSEDGVTGYLAEEVGIDGIAEESQMYLEQAETVGAQLANTYYDLADGLSTFYSQLDNTLIALTTQTNDAISAFENLISAVTGKAYSIDWDVVFNVAPTSMDTGGYTGAWGSSGKMAVLHEKELVLNAQDTENILKSVDLVRSLTNQIAVPALDNTSKLNSLLGGFNTSETLEQNVVITAEFPNATNHSEIEEAFDNLINMATQYANRR